MKSFLLTNLILQGLALFISFCLLISNAHPIKRKDKTAGQEFAECLIHCGFIGWIIYLLSKL